jgi:hypothetical protein
VPLGQQSQEHSSPIIDGFTYNSRVATTSSFYHSAVAQLEPLRRANGFRPRIFGVPTPEDRPIPAFETVEYQVKCQPGSYLWALQFWCSAASSPNLTNTFRIVDACTELPLGDRPQLGTAVANGYFGSAPGSQNVLGQNYGVTLLAEPYLINEPGTLNVEVTNGSSSTSNCQLLLLIAEPCIDERELEALIKRVRRIR